MKAKGPAAIAVTVATAAFALSFTIAAAMIWLRGGGLEDSVNVDIPPAHFSPPPVKVADQRKSSTWGPGYFPNFTVTTHDGHAFRFYDDLVKDKIVVVHFIYTSCRDVCALTTARMAEVKQRLGDRVGRDIFFYSITLDPAVDGPDVLKKYADNFATGKGWLFLTGAPDEIGAIRYKLGERSRALNEHRNDVILGNDRTGEWGKDSVFSDIDRLERVILDMDPIERAKIRDTTHDDVKGLAMPMPSTPGQALFQKACTACHSIGEGVKIGPDLAGVTKRRSRDWLERFIAAPNEMLRSKDPTTVAMVEEYRGLVMPNFRFAPGDIADVLSYLESHDGTAKSASDVKPPAREVNLAPIQAAARTR